MSTQTKTCANCHAPFEITPDDFAFYEKMQVPAPTRCADCCRERRLAWRNERTLYKRTDPETRKEFISIYSKDKPLKIYPHKKWWSDDWDPFEYGKNYDFKKPFFAQFQELMEQVPLPALINLNSVNSEYCSSTTDNKNCYLVFGGDFNEDCAYGNFNMYSKNSLDLYWVNKMEFCYECMYSESCYKVLYAEYARNCNDSYFLYDCTGCQNCFGCVGLRNKSHHIFNKPYAKEEYEKKLKDYNLHTREGIKIAEEQFEKFKHTEPHRYADIIKSVNCTGNNIHNAKNCANCFEVYDNAEDLKDASIAGWGAKDGRNINHFGHNAELAYDSWAVFGNASKVTFSTYVQESHNIHYSHTIFSSGNLFGCIGLRNKNYCVLNKQYSKEEYAELVQKIKKHMDEMPYKDSMGREYRYGEYPPIELSPFAYNETVAQEYYPLTKDEAKAKGYEWKDEETKNYDINVRASEVPQDITNVDNNILEKTIACEHNGECNEKCSVAFKLIPQELDFYKKLRIPLPRLCSNCRHYARFKKKNPLKLWERKCQCAGEKSENKVYANTANHGHGSSHCPNVFQTTYAPNRPEIVYCEACYQQEVA